MHYNLNTHTSHLKVKSKLKGHVSFVVCEHIPADMPATSFGQRGASCCEPSHPEKISLNSGATKASRLISARYIILDFTQHNSLISTIPWLPFLTPTQHRFSLTCILLASSWDLCPPQPVSLLGHAPSPSPLLPIGSGYFRAKLFPISKPHLSHPVYSSCLHRL